MFAPYRKVFSRPGSLAFTLAGLLARLAGPMCGVSVVVLIAERRGSYGLAGAVSALGVAAGAVLMPLIGRLVDRYGQARVSVPTVLTGALPLVGLLLCVRSGAPDWTLFACWAASATVPNVGGMARARWAHLHREDEATRHRANALEQALDELCFMTGPVVAMALCTGVAPEAGLITAGALGVTGVLLFAAQRSTEPPLAPVAARTSGSSGSSDAPRGARRGGMAVGGGLGVLLLTFLATGVVFGSMEVSTIAYADGLGQKPAAGVLLGLVAAGSCVSGLVFGALRLRREPEGRLLIGVAVMAGLMLLPLAAGLSGSGLTVLGAALFVAGSGTAPTMVSGMTLCQELLPPGRLNEGMALAVSAILVGISAGAALGGAVADHASPGTGYLIPAAAAALAALTALVGRPRLRAPRPTGAPHLPAPAPAPVC
ncbi:MFS transporter [Kitasatospora camelliae]|uniref:MFS transporter n=1 Tax=Kitasatospora camelliae TaxID=3156397 RepID=A0AAU8JYH9_9ACTN